MYIDGDKSAHSYHLIKIIRQLILWKNNYCNSLFHIAAFQMRR